MVMLVLPLQEGPVGHALERIGTAYHLPWSIWYGYDLATQPGEDLAK